MRPKRSASRYLVVALMIVVMAPVKAAEVKTSKERLSDKSSDEQRVDNCHVPPERRGSKPRPDCPNGAQVNGLPVGSDLRKSSKAP